MESLSVLMARGHRDARPVSVRGCPTIADTEGVCAIYRGKANRFGSISKRVAFAVETRSVNGRSLLNSYPG
jgi:hypothetical protein